MSTAGRSLARIMRTCSAFGGLDRSSGANAVAGASSGSITTGADGGLRRQAPILGLLWLPSGWAGLPWHLAKALALDDAPDTMDFARSSRVFDAWDAPESGSYTGREGPSHGYWKPLSKHRPAIKIVVRPPRPPPAQCKPIRSRRL